MDPEATLQLAISSLEDKDFAGCREALRNYRSWRSRGGFAPKDGDVRAKAIAQKLSRAQAGISEEEEPLTSAVRRYIDRNPTEADLALLKSKGMLFRKDES